jgi:2-pyrone-4,6-dicarboxylate lactonase
MIGGRAVAQPSKEEQNFPEWVRETRAPIPLPPRNSCDCQFHIYGDLTNYPAKQNAFYDPPNATFADVRKVLQVMGFQRGVIVHPMTYDTDHRLLIDTLAGLDHKDRQNFRATAIIKDNVSDSELHHLNDLGVRGARFNIGRRYKEEHTEDSIRRSMARARELGWHARLHVGGDDLVESEPFLRSIRGVTVVVDHMGHLNFEQGLNQRAFRFLLDMIKNEGWWIMLSNGNRDSKMEEGWDDAVPFGRAFAEAGPDQIIWGSDWPHVRWSKKRMMNDAETVELLYRYIDNDFAVLRKVLVDNPARLHGFGVGPEVHEPVKLG